MSSYKCKHLHLDVLSNVTFDWRRIVEEVTILSWEEKWIKIPGENLSWYHHDIFPGCQNLQLLSKLELKRLRPKQIQIDFYKVDNLGVSLFLEDARKALRKRSITSNRLDYDGPFMEIENLKEPKRQKFVISIEQTINLESDPDKRCKNYPVGHYESYRECDEDYVYDFMKSQNHMMPFWATQSIDQVTKFVR